MAVSEEDFETWLISIEQTLSDRNIETYLTEHPEDAGPDSWIDWPVPPYAQMLTENLALFRAVLLAEAATAGPAVASAVLVTGAVGQPDEGRATFTFPEEMTTPVVSVSVVDAVAGGTFYDAVIESVSTTAVTVRARRSVAVTASGFDVLTAPQPAADVTVHVTVRDAG